MQQQDSGVRPCKEVLCGGTQEEEEPGTLLGDTRRGGSGPLTADTLVLLL